MTYAIAYLATAFVFLAIDYVWLAFIAKDFYARSIGHLMRDVPDFGAAAIFYLFYVAGVVFFAVLPADGRCRYGLGYVPHGKGGAGRLSRHPQPLSVIELSKKCHTG